MEITLIRCDNPACKSVGPSETEVYAESKRKKGEALAPPYGWWRFDGWCQGPGPAVKNVVVCKLSCLEAALYATLEKESGLS